MKNQLRYEALKLRKELKTEEISSIIIKNLFSTIEYKTSENILCYYPLSSEINTTACFQDKTKNWYIPRVNGMDLEVCPYNDSCLKIGSYNITEPTTEKISDINKLDMIIIPAVAADKSGYRLGYGKGYYDRFLEKINKKTIKVILISKHLLFETIFPEKHDKKSDIIITDKEILRI